MAIFPGITMLASSVGDARVSLKATDETITSSTILHDDAELLFSMSPGDIWQFKFVVFFSTDAGPDIKMSLLGPGTPTNLRAHIQIWETVASAPNIGGVISSYNSEVAQDISALTESVAYISGVVENGAASGSLVLRWGQRVSSTSSTTVRKGSYVVAKRTQSGTILNEIKSVSAGQTSNALEDRKSAFSWGINSARQLGDGSATTRISPVSVAASVTFSQLDVGLDHSIGLTSDGNAWTWGWNGQGRLGIGFPSNSGLDPSPVIGGHSFSQVSAGHSHSVAVKAAGDAWAWGRNFNGQLGNASITDVASPVSVVGEHSFSDIRGGQFYTVALKADGSAWTWGNNANGELGTNNAVNTSSPVLTVGSHSFVSIRAGRKHVLALKADGSVWAWGSNSNGRLGNNVASNASSPTSVIGGHSFVNIDAIGISVALKSDGSAWAWGNNVSGELGDNTTTSRSSPVSVIGGHSFLDVACGENQPGTTGHALGAKLHGVWSWGNNATGQLGDNTTTSRSSPVSVVGGVPV